MRKYWRFFTVEFQQSVNYRPEAFVWFLLELAPMLIMVNLSGYLQSTGRLNHQQYSQFILYFVVNLYVSRLTAVHFEDNLIDDIKDGKISSGLLKPFSFYWHLLFREFSWRLSGLMYLIPTFLLLIPLINTLILPHTTPGIILALIPALVIAYLQRYFLGWIISLPAFWFDQSKVLVHLRWMAEGILGGAWLPLYLFPAWWQSFARLTPFYYWFYFPTQLFLGNITNIAGQFLIAILWVFILYFISSWFWNFAVKSYSSVGG